MATTIIPVTEVNAAKTNRHFAISCISEALGVPKAKVTADLSLGNKGEAIGIAVCSRVRQMLIVDEPMTAGDLLKQL